ncbi:Formate hydrogenlyase regulatory protein HycA [Mixta intestinalis]|uniref:Formate hydrogenlyase regulatory protein HycA n=2 Tax=Mixta intestinalis TaxID=1615494 RepID=A0A6P1Q4D3_9GAMM|nr:Formate hydrogenlyase regulatory protein HycA [Mixta intestinalis]
MCWKMNTKTVLAEKAEIINSEKKKMDRLWNAYVMELIKGITSTESLYHHHVVPYQKGQLLVEVFGNVYVKIIRYGTFGSIKVQYQVESEELGPIEIPPTNIYRQGVVDDGILLSDKDQIFEHYLQKLQVIYNHILQYFTKGEEE